MKGLELSKQYYENFGKEMLKKFFPEVLPYIAVGIAGSGSECYGYDDEISHDHDFEPAFCMFLPEEALVDRRTAFQLERAYAKLPKEFMGFCRSTVNPVGGSRHGVIRMDEFFLEKVGSPDGTLSIKAWFSVPEYALLEATNGAVFEDPYGRFTQIRKKLQYFPEDVRKKKLAGHLLLMGQSGQYNYPRCLARGETAAAQMAVFEFTQSAMHTIYLLNRSYMPYYKWVFRGLASLPCLGEQGKALEHLISSGNTSQEAKKKSKIMETICSSISDELIKQGFVRAKSEEMESLAYAVNDTIGDSAIRNLHILYGV